MQSSQLKREMELAHKVEWEIRNEKIKHSMAHIYTKCAFV